MASEIGYPPEFMSGQLASIQTHSYPVEQIVAAIRLGDHFRDTLLVDLALSVRALKCATTSAANSAL